MVLPVSRARSWTRRRKRPNRAPTGVMRRTIMVSRNSPDSRSMSSLTARRLTSVEALAAAGSGETGRSPVRRPGPSARPGVRPAPAWFRRPARRGTSRRRLRPGWASARLGRPMPRGLCGSPPRPRVGVGLESGFGPDLEPHVVQQEQEHVLDRRLDRLAVVRTGQAHPPRQPAFVGRQFIERRHGAGVGDHLDRPELRQLGEQQGGVGPVDDGRRREARSR